MIVDAEVDCRHATTKVCCDGIVGRKVDQRRKNATMGVSRGWFGDEFAAPRHRDCDFAWVEAEQANTEPGMERAIPHHCVERRKIKNRKAGRGRSRVTHGMSTALPKTRRSTRSIMDSLNRARGSSL